MADVRARKGDLAVVRRTGLPAGASPFSSDVRETWYVGRVTKVDREGYVREIEYPAIGGLQRQAVGDGRGWGGALSEEPGVLVQSRQAIDVELALRAARDHTYEGHPRQPKPFDTLEEVKQTLLQTAAMPFACTICGRGRECRFEIACSCWRGIPCDGSGKVGRKARAK